MKKLIYTAAFLLASVTISYAQDQKKEKVTEEARAERMTARMQEQLSLTAEQKAKVKAIQLERLKKSEEWRKSDMEARKAVMEQRKAYMKEQQTKLEKVLSAEQKEKLATLREEGKEKMKEFRDRREKRGAPRAPRSPRTPKQ